MRRVIVRQSSVHGKGVFAMRQLKAGERVLEYRGEITSWREAVRRHRRDGVDGHTFLFGLSDGRVIDGSRGGNSARWLNHACAPNCEAIEDAGRVFIDTLREIEAGEELFIEYQLAVDDPLDEDLRRQSAMADTFELVALGLPAGFAPDALPDAVKRFVADCWPGMSRAQLVARARQHALQLSLRAAGGNPGATAPGDTGLFSLTLLAGGGPVRLIAPLRRVKPRRQSARPVKASKPPARDPRQGVLF